MKRVSAITYRADDNRPLVTIESPTLAKVVPCSVSVDDLDQLSVACAAAAEEMRAMQASETYAETAP